MTATPREHGNDHKINRAGFIKRAVAAGLLASTGSLAGGNTTAAEADRGGTRGLRHRGVTYDTGTLFGPGFPSTRLVWSTRLMEGEIRAIDEQLHCNSVQLHGSEIDRLVETAAAAGRRGLHVWGSAAAVRPPPGRGS